MELDRKAFHFDLDNESVERFYTGKKNPWSDIQDFLESHCFEKPQYSALKSHNIQGMNRLKISSCPINAPMAP